MSLAKVFGINKEATVNFDVVKSARISRCRELEPTVPNLPDLEKAKTEEIRQ